VEFYQVEPLLPDQAKQLQWLRDFIKSQKNVYIAYSGGVDSSLVAAIAKEQLNTKAIAVTGVSAALASYLLAEARHQANWIGIEHQECYTNELDDPAYRNNPENRCFACKKELHLHLKEIAKLSKNSKILDGVNFDDIKEYRPGIEAGQNAGVISPLAQLKINKNSVRQISKSLGFPWWDKPAQPCLASRLPYGETITSKRLKQIEKAEQWLISKGFPEVRVRIQGLGARIELPPDRFEDLIKSLDRKVIIQYFLSLGFTSVSIDLEGLVSGKLNRDIQVNKSTFQKIT
tara:strand:- start:173 stop:1039 length:867 start_codon:yes stop_codon:yes gene_type:complete